MKEEKQIWEDREKQMILYQTVTHPDRINGY